MGAVEVRHSSGVESGTPVTATAEFAATVLQASADTVMVFAPSGHAIFVSSTRRVLVGRTPADWQGRLIDDLIHPEDVPAFRALLEAPQESLKGPRRDVIRVRVLGASNEWLLVEARGFVRIECDSVVGSVVSFRDAAGLLGLSEARSLAERTLADNRADSSTMDHRAAAATEILPAVLRSCASANHLCILSMRMTNFDTVSHAFGRAAADDAIVRAARLMLPMLRPSDVVVRVLDRRLVVACTNVDASVVVELAKRLRRACAAVEFPDGTSLIPSIGFALSSGGDDLQQVLDYALDANQLDECLTN